MDREIFETNNEQETAALGEKLGQAALPGQVYTLIGDLGVGKRCLRRALRADLACRSM